MTDLHPSWKPLTVESWQGVQPVWLLRDRYGERSYAVQLNSAPSATHGLDEYTHWQPATVPPIYADAQPSELDQLRKDAERYHAMRAWFIAGKSRSALVPDIHMSIADEADIDAAIDAALASAGTNGEQP